MTDYRVNVFYSEEDGGYIADIPDLEACSAFGLTPQEALAALEQAKEAWLAVARETGKTIPGPARGRGSGRGSRRGADSR